MLFDGLNLTPKGKQLAELKGGIENVKIGRVVINTVANITDLSDPAEAAALASIDGASALFSGWNIVGKDTQLNIRISAPKTLSALDGQLRIAVLANEDVIATENAVTAQPIYSVVDKQDGSIVGYVDMKESNPAWTSESSRGFPFDVVLTVKGTKNSRCNFHEVLRDGTLSAAVVTNNDLIQHDLAAPSISANLASAEASTPLAEGNLEKRAEPEATPPDENP